VRLVTSTQETRDTTTGFSEGLVPGSSARKGIVMVSTREIAACVSGPPKRTARAWMGLRSGQWRLDYWLLAQLALVSVSMDFDVLNVRACPELLVLQL
jgi:hypothetical protein